MRENEIRADDLYEQNQRLHILDTKKVLLNKDSFVRVHCPACNKNESTFLFSKYGFRIVSCDFCKTYFVNPRPTQEMIFDYYQNSLSAQFWKEIIFPKSQQARIKHIIHDRIEKIVDYCKRNRSPFETIMDVGAGDGTFCEQLLKLRLFKKVLAVEPDHNLAQSCREKGLYILEEFIENIASIKVDVVTSFESIEHLFDPKTYIVNIFDKLNNHGLFFITTPNIKGFDLLLLQDKSDTIAPPSHLNYFHPDSLSLLLEGCGFKILEIITPGKLDAELVRKKANKGEINIENGFMRRILIDESEKYMDSFQKWLSDNCLSSHMWIVAQKI